MNPALQLRDIHLPPEPSWWPPAPGWWVLALLVVLGIAWLARWLVVHVGARRRMTRLLAEFDAAAALADQGARITAISQLLRRAARLRDPAAAGLHGEAWLRFLDGNDAVPRAKAAAVAERPFSDGSGRVLLDGPFRPQADARAVDALIAPARERFRVLVGTP